MVHSAGNQTSHSSGVTPFDGNAAHFYQWEFKTLMKAQQLQDPAAEDASAGTKERNAKVVDSIISGLTQEALQTAMDIGVERLHAVGGIVNLVEQMKMMDPEQLVTLRIKQLKAVLEHMKIDYGDAVEKKDLANKIVKGRGD